MAVKEKVILTDKAEMILLLKARVGREPRNINAESIQRIQFGYAKGGLFRKEFRQITIVAKGVGTIEYDEPTHKKYFDTYLTELRQFAKENNVTFADFPER
jgi:hypothetical protein